MDIDTIDRTLPDLDQTVATRMGDDILLDVASREKVKKVATGSGRGRFVQSHSARAWTSSGDVD